MIVNEISTKGKIYETAKYCILQQYPDVSKTLEIIFAHLLIINKYILI